MAKITTTYILNFTPNEDGSFERVIKILREHHEPAHNRIHNDLTEDLIQALGIPAQDSDISPAVVWEIEYADEEPIIPNQGSSLAISQPAGPKARTNG